MHRSTALRIIRRHVPADCRAIFDKRAKRGTPVWWLADWTAGLLRDDDASRRYWTKALERHGWAEACVRSRLRQRRLAPADLRPFLLPITKAWREELVVVEAMSKAGQAARTALAA